MESNVNMHNGGCISACVGWVCGLLSALSSPNTLILPSLIIDYYTISIAGKRIGEKWAWCLGCLLWSRLTDESNFLII